MQAMTAAMIAGRNEAAAGASMDRTSPKRSPPLATSANPTSALSGVRRRRGNTSGSATNLMPARQVAEARKKLRKENPEKIVDRIDTVSKVLFPTLYIVFNLLYWFAFLYWIPDEIDSIPSIENELTTG